MLIPHLGVLAGHYRFFEPDCYGGSVVYNQPNLGGTQATAGPFVQEFCDPGLSVDPWAHWWEPADDVNTFSYGVSAKQGTVPVSKGFTYPRGYLPGFPEE
mmetsp:Transcript_70908/g.115156  ORF Transcript_70908/g.115156 Transcript_70908/m.115156 type:complete len:100 (-) Transcript_70908:99-398(-)